MDKERSLNIEGQTLEDRAILPKWNYHQLAAHLGVSIHKLRRDVMNKKIPFVKIGRSVRFDPVTIQRWLEDNTNHPEG